MLTYIVQTRASLELGSRGELDGTEIVDDEVALYHSSSFKGTPLVHEDLTRVTATMMRKTMQKLARKS